MWTRQQLEIIEHTKGSSVVFACPGSGKTSVLVAHIVHQLRMQTVHASRVLVVTFTRQAAAELRQRITSIPEARILSPSLRIGTFHSEIFRMLLHAKVPVRPVMGQLEQLRFLRACLRDAVASNRLDVDTVLRELTVARASFPVQALSKHTRRVWERYQLMKSREHRWDHDDILETFVEHERWVLGHVPPVDYLLVDEFQDTNPIQWHIVSAMAEQWGTRVFIVGDDDQSIYAFRGANPAFLLGAAEHLQDANVYRLAMNFRSDKSIVSAASALIRHNRLRTDKPFDAWSPANGVVRLLRFRSEQAEAEAVWAMIRQIRGERPQWSIAVLARTRMQLFRLMAEASGHGEGRTVAWQTLHGAKGKEWDVVFLSGVLEPNPYLADHKLHEEEERRLFYVGMTRARHTLVISTPQGRRLKLPTFLQQTGVTCMRGDRV